MLSVKSAFSIIVVFPSRSQTRQAGSLTNMHKKRQHKRSSKLRQEHDKTQFNPPKLTLTQRVRNRRRVPANDTDQWKWLSERAGKEMSLSNSIANVYRAVLTHSAIGPRSFFFPCSQTSVPSPLPMRALSPASKDSWMPREAAGGSEPRPLLCRHQNGWFLRYLNRTDTVSEHSESNSSPKVPIEGIERRKPHDVLYKSIYAQGQGLLPPPRQWEGTRPSVYQLCSQCANSYITLTTLLWGWQWIKHIFGT